MSTPPEFDEPDLAARLEALTPQQVDALPYGCIRLAADGSVRLYNRTEAAQSGRGARPTVGLDFFGQVAPCMNTPAVRGRVEAALAAGVLDAEFNHVGDFADRDRELHLRFVSASDGGVWVVLRREDD